MKKPENVIVVILDSLRADRVGVLGCDRGLTPNIDSLSRGGITFEKAYTCINTTDPSVTSIHTGKYPRSTILHHGELVTDIEKQRVQNTSRLPELISEAGIKPFATGYTLGRWNRAGFDEYAGTGSQRERILLDIKDTLQSVDPRLYRIASRLYQKLNSIEQKLGTPTDSGSDGITTLLETVERTEDPFYGLVHLMDTHMMYEADENHICDCLERFEYPNQDLSEFFEENDDSEFLMNYVKERVTERDYEVGLARLLARYDASIIEADKKIGTLISELKEQNKWDNTALFVMADHGESLMEHEIYFDHHGLYDQTTHIPLIAKIPGVESQVRDEFVQPIDLFPTILSLFEVDPGSKYDGRDLLPLLTDQDTDEWRDAVFIEEAYTQRRMAIRTDEWKYIMHRSDETLEQKWGSSLNCGYCKTLHGAEKELYHLLSDPQERQNCIDENLSVAADLQRRLEELEDGITHPNIASEETKHEFEDEDEVMERLENLGYQ